MQSEIDHRISMNSSIKKTLRTDNKSYDLKKKSTKIDFGSKSLHRKKSDVFMPNSMPQINWHLVSSENSVCSQLSLNSKDDKKSEI